MSDLLKIIDELGECDARRSALAGNAAALAILEAQRATLLEQREHVHDLLGELVVQDGAVVRRQEVDDLRRAGQEVSWTHYEGPAR